MTIILDQDHYFAFLLIKQLLDLKEKGSGASEVSFCQLSQNPPNQSPKQWDL